MTSDDDLNVSTPSRVVYATFFGLTLFESLNPFGFLLYFLLEVIADISTVSQ
jgi:hypothetical protein